MIFPIFLRLFTNFIVEIVPFAILCEYPFAGYFRMTHRKTLTATLALILGLSALYAVSGVILKSVMPYDNRLYLAVNAVFLCCVLACFLWYLYAVKAVWQKKAFIFLFALTSAMFISSVCSCIQNALPGKGDWLPGTPETIIITLVIYLLAVPLLCLFLKKFYLPVERGMTAKETGYLSLPLLILFAIFVTVFSFADFVYISSNITALTLFFGIIVTVFILYAVIFRMYSLANERYLADEKYARAQYQLDIREEQYRRICESIENSRKQRHDIQHHLLTLEGFLDSCDIQKARDYLKQYAESSARSGIVKFCNNPIINMLVSHYFQAAEELGIEFSVHISIPDALSVQDIDLSVLLGNLLENAVEAASGAKPVERVISLSMLCSGKMLAVTVDNGFDGNVSQNGGEYLSSKSAHRGLGLKSLADIAEKYGGGAEFRHDGKMFYSSVMLRLNG